MDARLLEQLRAITPEEQAILDGRTTIDRELYMSGNQPVINSKKLLAAGKLITLRTHTRFIRFPEHSHDFVEVVYMCAGKTRQGRGKKNRLVPSAVTVMLRLRNLRQRSIRLVYSITPALWQLWGKIEPWACLETAVPARCLLRHRRIRSKRWVYSENGKLLWQHRYLLHLSRFRNLRRSRCSRIRK